MGPNFITDEMEQQLRQTHVVTPSAIDPWFGAWRPGAALTLQQVRELGRLGLDPETTDRLQVQIKVTMRQMWWPTTQSTPIRRITCPIIGKRQDRLKVVAPSGGAKLVFPNGELTRPRAKRWSTTNREK